MTRVTRCVFTNLPITLQRSRGHTQAQTHATHTLIFTYRTGCMRCLPGCDEKNNIPGMFLIFVLASRPESAQRTQCAVRKTIFP